MNPPPSKLQERVYRSADTVLARAKSVGPLELLEAMGMLNSVHIQGWRKGIEFYPTLEPSIQCGPEKLQKAFEHFREWIQLHGLQPVEATYMRSGVRGNEPLQITVSGDPESERFFRTHYAAGDLSPKKSKQLTEKLNKPAELVVFQLVSPSATCSECGDEILQGGFITMEKQKPLCMQCADMDHLVFLPSGDATLSRRARKNSPLAAVVVRHNRSRNRYERKGILITSSALERAAADCAADAGERAEKRVHSAERRSIEDRAIVDSMTHAISAAYPGCPPDEARSIAEHAALRGSGRVGRSAAGRALEPKAVELAVIAHVRHEHTNYDALLMKGIDRTESRLRVRETIDLVISRWKDAQ